MTISLIVAIDKNGCIGKKGEVPWYLPADLRYFAATTKGHSVIMGRKTYESVLAKIGKPLPERKNIIITREADYQAPGCTVVTSWETAEVAAEGEEVFVVGGAEIYKLALPHADKLYITDVETEVMGGDTYFPEVNRSEWKKTWSEAHPADDKNPFAYTFKIYTRL